MPDAYKRYLAQAFHRAPDLRGTPLCMEFRTGRNPYEGHKNELTRRQLAKRKRLMRHVKS